MVTAALGALAGHAVCRSSAVWAGRSQAGAGGAHDEHPWAEGTTSANWRAGQSPTI